MLFVSHAAVPSPPPTDRRIWIDFLTLSPPPLRSIDGSMAAREIEKEKKNHNRAKNCGGGLCREMKWRLGVRSAKIARKPRHIFELLR